MLLPSERLRAEVAAMRRLTGVPHYVVREVLLPRERLTWLANLNIEGEKKKIFRDYTIVIDNICSSFLILFDSLNLMKMND